MAIENYFISGGYFRRSSPKSFSRQNYFWSIFGVLCLAVENITAPFLTISA
jgi:hypothetical protein